MSLKLLFFMYTLHNLVYSFFFPQKFIPYITEDSFYLNYIQMQILLATNSFKTSRIITTAIIKVSIYPKQVAVRYVPEVI